MASPGAGVAAPPIVIPAGGRPAAPDPLARAYDLPFTLVLEVPAVEFSVGALMQLRPGSVVRTSARHNEDLSLAVNGQLVGVVEIDVVGDRLAVRLLGMA